MLVQRMNVKTCRSVAFWAYQLQCTCALHPGWGIQGALDMHLHPARVHANSGLYDCNSVEESRLSQGLVLWLYMALCNKKPCKGGMDAMKILTLYSSKHTTVVSSENTVFACWELSIQSCFKYPSDGKLLKIISYNLYPHLRMNNVCSICLFIFVVTWWQVVQVSIQNCG
jgi:hypothetical protein